MTRARRSPAIDVAAVVVALALAPASAWSVAPRTEVTASRVHVAEVLRWSDGDTVVTSRGTIRLIGVDAPERGQCGFRAATMRASKLAPAGSRIRLTNPASVQDRDRYDRLLRYVDVGHADVGLRQVKAGVRARYDGLDGYDTHPRQARYRAADERNSGRCPDQGKSGHGGQGGQQQPQPPPQQTSFPPVAGTWNCPAAAPIKGNQGDQEWIYHLPSNAYYNATNPEECFATEAAAQAAGYRAARI